MSRKKAVDSKVIDPIRFRHITVSGIYRKNVINQKFLTHHQWQTPFEPTQDDKLLSLLSKRFTSIFDSLGTDARGFLRTKSRYQVTS